MFFFSSRRRHTRCGRDWSSDVCSSDLVSLLLTGCWDYMEIESLEFVFGLGVDQVKPKVVVVLEMAKTSGGGQRSEERRVGKECRPRRSRHDEETYIQKESTEWTNIASV